MVIKFEELKETDLIVNAIYEGGNNGNMSDEVLSKLMGCRNSAGFRIKGTLEKSKLQYVTLYSTGNHSDWKNIFNRKNSEFIYYGDQDKINRDIHDTPTKGNEVLKRTFKNLKEDARFNIAPFFIFEKEEKRNVRFIGLAVPGSKNRSIEDCLEVVTLNKPEGQINNYKAIFTVLDVPKINRKWLKDLEDDNGLTSQYVPLKWKLWVEKGQYNTLLAKDIEEDPVEQQDLNKLISEKDLIENININEFNDLIANIDKLEFKITYKPTDNKKQEDSGDTPKIKNKERFSNPKKNKNYAEEYIKKQIIGVIGEAIILKKERERLINSEQAELVEKVKDVEWSSKDIGDGLGYDIKSFDIKNGKVVDKYIEVKTTIGPDNDFEITSPEVEKSYELNEDGIYAIARIYNLDIGNKSADFYFKEGNLKSNYELKTSVYTAHRK